MDKLTTLHILKNHKLTHTALKLDKCDISDKAFSCVSNRNLHRKTHTDEKLYVCDICEKGFQRKDSLSIH